MRHRSLPAALLGLLVIACGDEVTPPGLEATRYAILGGGDLLGDGYLCATGEVHFRGSLQPDDLGGPTLDPSCGIEGAFGDSTLALPRLHTEPSFFPGATYYFVSYVPDPTPHCEVFDREGARIEVYHPDNPSVPYDLGDQLQVFADRAPTLDLGPRDIFDFFDPTFGVFPVDTTAGDTAVVLNLASRMESGVLVPSPNGVLDLHLSARAQDPAVTATVLSAHYSGSSAETGRARPGNWEGGRVLLSGSIRLEPKLGLALLAGWIDQSQAGSGIGITSPSLAVAIDSTVVAGDLSVRGSLQLLGTLHLRGGLQAVHDDGFRDRLPPALQPLVP